MHPLARRIAFCLSVLLPAASIAQGTKADYERANGLAAKFQNKVFRAQVEPRWLTGGERFWYRNLLPNGEREYILVDAKAGTRGPAFDHAKLAEALAKAASRKVDAKKLPLEQFDFAPDGESVRFNAFDKGWRVRLADFKVESIDPIPARTQPTGPRRRGARQDNPRQPPGPRGDRSPDRKWAVEWRENNLVLKNVKSQSERPMTTDGTADDAYEGGVWWSPDSSHFVAMRTKKPQEHKVYMVESSPKGGGQPKLHSHDYLKPGDRIAHPRPHLFSTATGKEIPVDDKLFTNPWSIQELRWDVDSKRFTFVYNQRGHQVLRVVAVDASTGKASAIIDETSKTFIDYAGKYFCYYLDATHEILWMSERDGWCHVYLVDAKSGMVKNQVTKGEWVVRRIQRVDTEKRQLWFSVGGINLGEDPYHIHFCRVDFDGKNLVRLTEGDGTHSVEFSPDRRYFVDTWSRVDEPPTVELRRAADGKRICLLEKADASALVASGWRPPERFVAKARDGKTDIHGIIHRPTNFDPAKKYPVIEAIYAGPQGSFVPKQFASYYRSQKITDLGFIVVQIDGMGTSDRSKAFHDVCCKNLMDSGFPDRILWMKAAAAKHPEMDLSRVGLYGGSAGGQSTVAGLLQHGDFYKVGVADCGCHDNRMDKIWWNELWMGWPIGPHYAAQSNVTNAHKLTGKLMLTVGELDTNVDPASTMQVVDALIKANKDFDLIVFPGANHGAGESPYGERRRQDFFVRHLLGVDPRSR